MNIFMLLIALFWMIWLIIWIVFSFGAKKSIGSNNMVRGIGYRFGILILIVILLRISSVNQFLRGIHSYTNPIIDSSGVILCALGLGFAIWARVHLGRNWGMPQSKREKPELVISGPYAYVRHPIYTGIILAMFGTALVNDILWLIAFAFIALYFIFSIKPEEKFMSEQFPKEYESYKKRTKALIPFLY